jgi:hypothetical protein
VTATISFPAPLKAALDAQHVVFEPLGVKTTGKCTGTVPKPTAAEGYLCVYLGYANSAGAELSKTTPIENLAGAAGASPGGAFVVFVPTEAGLEAKIVEQGVWAVTGGPSSP